MAIVVTAPSKNWSGAVEPPHAVLVTLAKLAAAEAKQEPGQLTHVARDQHRL